MLVGFGMNSATARGCKAKTTVRFVQASLRHENGKPPLERVAAFTVELTVLVARRDYAAETECGHKHLDFYSFPRAVFAAACGRPALIAPPAKTSEYVARIMEVIAPPADNQVMKIRAASIGCNRIIAAIIARTEVASPLPHCVSSGMNQLKQLLGLLERLCSGNSRANPKPFASFDQPAIRYVSVQHVGGARNRFKVVIEKRGRAPQLRNTRPAGSASLRPTLIWQRR